MATSPFPCSEKLDYFLGVGQAMTQAGAMGRGRAGLSSRAAALLAPVRHCRASPQGPCGAKPEVSVITDELHFMLTWQMASWYSPPHTLTEICPQIDENT